MSKAKSRKDPRLPFSSCLPARSSSATVGKAKQREGRPVAAGHVKPTKTAKAAKPAKAGAAPVPRTRRTPPAKPIGSPHVDSSTPAAQQRSLVERAHEQLRFLGELFEQLEQHDDPDLTDDSDSWTTPADLLSTIMLAEQIDAFDLDPCSNRYSAVEARRKIQLPDDGLAADWIDSGTIWLNPPFSKPDPWLERAAKLVQVRKAICASAWSRHDETVQPLVIWGVTRADLSTQWARWLDTAHVLFPPQRISYVKPGETEKRKGANFASVLWRFDSMGWTGKGIEVCDRVASELGARIMAPCRQRPLAKMPPSWPISGGSGTPQSLASEAPHSAKTRVDSKKRTGESKRSDRGPK